MKKLEERLFTRFLRIIWVKESGIGQPLKSWMEGELKRSEKEEEKRLKQKNSYKEKKEGKRDNYIVGIIEEYIKGCYKEYIIGPARHLGMTQQEYKYMRIWRKSALNRLILRTYLHPEVELNMRRNMEFVGEHSKLFKGMEVPEWGQSIAHDGALETDPQIDLLWGQLLAEAKSEYTQYFEDWRLHYNQQIGGEVSRRRAVSFYSHQGSHFWDHKPVNPCTQLKDFEAHWDNYIRLPDLLKMKKIALPSEKNTLNIPKDLYFERVFQLYRHKKIQDHFYTVLSKDFTDPSAREMLMSHVSDNGKSISVETVIQIIFREFLSESPRDLPPEVNKFLGAIEWREFKFQRESSFSLREQMNRAWDAFYFNSFEEFFHLYPLIITDSNNIESLLHTHKTLIQHQESSGKAADKPLL